MPQGITGGDRPRLVSADEALEALVIRVAD